MKYLLIALVIFFPATSLAFGSYMSSQSYNTVNMVLQATVMQQTMKQQAEKSPWAYIPRGEMSAREFVEKVLSNAGRSYEEVLSKVPAGRIGAIDNRNGTVVAPDPSQFDSVLYTYL